MVHLQIRILPGVITSIVLGLAVGGCSREPTTPEEKLARGKEIIKKTSDRLASANSISVTSEITRERVRQNGEKQVTNDAQ
jgi:hypothetical protein